MTARSTSWRNWPANSPRTSGHRHVHLIAEDDRNLDTLLHPLEQGGYGMTGVWADDFHHAVRRHLAGDHEAWFADFRGSTDEIAAAVRDGWVFTGQHASHYDGPRGTSPAGVPVEASVICLQNHDQVGNRAHGDRLHHQVGEAAWLAATTLLLMAPETPMLFMGQEWAASSPFLFFTDHEATLGELVVEGRRREFIRFSTFNDPEARKRIPSPQAEWTWRSSVLDWEERTQPPHAHVLAETRMLLALRHEHLLGTAARPIAHPVRVRRAAWPLARAALGPRRPAADVHRLLRDSDARDSRDRPARHAAAGAARHSAGSPIVALSWRCTPRTRPW